MEKSLRSRLVKMAAVGVAGASLVGGAASAKFAATGWHANDGTSAFNNGVVTLNNDGVVNEGYGTSYENPTLANIVGPGSTYSFEWRSDDVACGGGVPRVFVRGGAWNSFDGNADACGTDADGDGWFTVSGTIGVTGDAAPAGYTGLVNDNISWVEPGVLAEGSDLGTVQYRNLKLNGKLVSLKPAETVKGGRK